MIRTILGVGLALCVCAMPALADKGWTVSLGGAYVMPEDADLNSSSSPTTINFSDGFGIVGAAGYDFDPMRAEIELSYRWFDVDSTTETTSSGEVTQGTTGDVSIAALFLNGYYDVKLVDWAKPYIGAGIGVARVEANDVKIAGRTGTVDDSDTVPGAQMMVGLAVPVTKNFDFTAGYRLMLLGDVSGAVAGGSSAGDKDVTHIVIHNAEIGFRYRF